MATRSQRAFTLVIAAIFFMTSVGTSGAILYSILTKDDSQQTAATEDKPVEEQTTPKEGSLEGTKLEGFTPVEQVDKLVITDITVGTGTEVKKGDTVTAHYTGALAKDGTIFQSSLDSGQPATFPLSGVIVGWQEGVPGMKAGGTRRLLIPAAQAYGEQSPAANIPPNSDLVFDIQLISVGEPAQ